MYIEIGASEAKAKLSQLLQAVKHGRRYTITLRGQPIADLVPASFPNVQASVNSMRNIRKVKGVSEKELAKWNAEGRK